MKGASYYGRRTHIRFLLFSWLVSACASSLPLQVSTRLGRAGFCEDRTLLKAVRKLPILFMRPRAVSRGGGWGARAPNTGPAHVPRPRSPPGAQVSIISASSLFRSGLCQAPARSAFSFEARSCVCLTHALAERGQGCHFRPLP